MNAELDIYLVVAPGLEALVADEARAIGLDIQETNVGGVTLRGGWPEVWAANICLRGATRVLVRAAEFRALHLAQLDKRSRKVDWTEWLPAKAGVRVEATCRKSRIYHAGAATQRVEKALAAAGFTVTKDAEFVLKVRIEDDLCTISLDTSGESLHKRGHKERVNKAPMRETLASMFLRACGFDGSEPVYDPMCGSGTLVIEAAEIAAGLVPGRSRNFAFEQFPSFHISATQQFREPDTRTPDPLYFGSDRDQGAIAMCEANAKAANVGAFTTFQGHAISDAAPPCAQPGLVIVNAPYGGRIGNKKMLYGLYGAFGQVMQERFKGWRVGLITSEPGLARAAQLPFDTAALSVQHGGMRIGLYRTEAL